MIVKDIIFGQEGRDKLVSGVDKVANAVGSTLGARGKTVLIESEHHIGGITVTKDGVTVAKSINLMDPAENLAVMIMREASEKTATIAGDGTTTSMVLAQAIVHNTLEMVKPEDNLTQVLRDMQKIGDEIVEHLTEQSVQITDEDLLDVATISANGDAEVGEMIAEAYKLVGLSGVVTVENSATAETYSEVVSGMKVDRGFSSKYFVTDHKKQEAVLDKPYILVADQTITNVNDILPILEFILEGKKSLLIIAELDDTVLSLFNHNKMKNGMKICTIIPPQFGYKRHHLMEDIAIATGAKFFSERTGDNLALCSIDDLGRADKVVVSRTNTLVYGAQGEIEERVREVNEQIDEETSAIEKEFLKERVANLGGGVAVIKVGANSDIEQKEKRDRVDDAVCAVRAALEEGVLPGGGVALKDVAYNNEDGLAWMILRKSLTAPMRKILENAGMDIHSYFPNLQQGGVGVNVISGSLCSMMDVGIIDPAKVTKTALTNAISVATTLLSTDAVITNVRQL